MRAAPWNKLLFGAFSVKFDSVTGAGIIDPTLVGNTY